MPADRVPDDRALLDEAIAAVADACDLTERVRADVRDPTRREEVAREKADHSPVTVADFAAQAVIGARLARRAPTIPLVAEEDDRVLRSDDALRARVREITRAAGVGLDDAALLAALARGDHGGGAGRFWVLDPVDGTKGFLRDDQYAVCLALVVDGVVRLTVLGCPNLPVDPARPDGARGCLLFARRGGGAWQRPLGGDAPPRRLRVSAEADPARAVFLESVDAGHVDHDLRRRIAAALDNVLPPLRMDAQTKFVALARGEASVYVRLSRSRTHRQSIWDVAPGTLLVEEAGGRVTDTAGAALRFDRGRDIGVADYVATNGPLHEPVRRVVVRLR